MLTNSLSKPSLPQTPNDRDDEATALHTLFNHWDDINGRDNITSLKDLEKIATNNSNPDLREAAQYYVDNPDKFNDLDTAGKNGNNDTKVSTEEILAHKKEITPIEEIGALNTLFGHWDNINGQDSITSLKDLEKIASGHRNPNLREAAQYYLDNPDKFSELDTAGKGNNDNKVSTEEILAYKKEIDPIEETNALNTLVGHWDNINKDDHITSLKDLEEIATENSNPSLREAAQYYIDNPDKFTELDTSGFGGSGDTKISIEDIRARQQTLGSTPPIQQVSSHNSFSKDGFIDTPVLAIGTDNETINRQFNDHDIRSFELDIRDSKIDPIDGSTDQDWSVRHNGFEPSAGNLSGYLDQIDRLGRDEDGNLVENEPISLFLDLKDNPLDSSGHTPEDLDQLLEEQFGDRLFTPDDLLARGQAIDPDVETLQDAIEVGAWPSEAELEGKIIVSLTGGGINDYNEATRSGGTGTNAFIAPKPKIEDGKFIPQSDAVIYNLDANPIFERTDRDEIARMNQLITENGSLVRNYGVDQNSVDQLAASGANFLATDDFEGVKV